MLAIAESNRLAGKWPPCAAAWSYRRQVRLCIGGWLPAPVALGLLRPMVLVPADFTGQFTPAEQQVILAHELAHLAAGDPAWLLAADLLAALAWWHPAVHWCRRRVGKRPRSRRPTKRPSFCPTAPARLATAW